MFGWLKQTAALSLLNLRSLPQRPGTAAVAMSGIAALTGVFAGVLSMASGFEKTMEGSGQEDVALVLRSGSTAELNSRFSSEQADVIRFAPGIARDAAGDPQVSSELFWVVNAVDRSSGGETNVALRGIQPSGYALRKNYRLAEGREFTPGRFELIVGRGARNQFLGLEPGQTIRFGKTEWLVTGMFEDGGSVFESELWCDVNVLQSAYQLGSGFQVVRARMDGGGGRARLEEALAGDQRLAVDVWSEKEFYAQQAEDTAALIRVIGIPVSALMAIGAVFAALNAMYASIVARARELATLRALGFGSFPTALAALLESVALAFLGGMLGCAIAWLALNGFQASTLAASFSQVVFNFAVTPDLLAQGIAAALAVGLVGGIFPAVRAATAPVTVALREL
ncbi:MAG: ABC transporter permease [Gammaproteobacteria bacterium]|nr:ABC transporter permease [Gammaproteobacteria bacterium]MCY4166206.1 ABC transporter permease [Gammaproteobacteria bacterium]MCY4256540.1 ABC transporter permease [Gammaproteobacteria bacterium]MCY4340853.1 ABC transporter permease [Gammaproteobacteria bacterium]